jgi:hypothetical protein
MFGRKRCKPNTKDIGNIADRWRRLAQSDRRSIDITVPGQNPVSMWPALWQTMLRLAAMSMPAASAASVTIRATRADLPTIDEHEWPIAGLRP